MKGLTCLSAMLVGSLFISVPSFADPQSDSDDVRAFFQKRFSNITLEDYADGAYALNENARMQWEEIEEFPPYEDAVDEGMVLFETPFANGKSYASCFPNGGLALSRITQNMILKPNKSSQLSTQLINVELAMVKLLFPMGKAN